MAKPFDIAHYRVTSKLGEGGMGEVYRADGTPSGAMITVHRVDEDRGATAQRILNRGGAIEVPFYGCRTLR
jgi:serine/threonine protein kinase